MKLPKQEEGQLRWRKILHLVGYFAAWGLIAVLLIPTLWQIKTLFLFLALQAINNPSLRPPGWNTETLAAVDKCTTFLVIGAWLILVMFAEGYVREAIEQGRLLLQTGRAVIIMACLYGASAVLLYVLG